MKECLYCKTPRTEPGSFCNDDCRRAWDRERKNRAWAARASVTKVCAHCGLEFITKDTRTNACSSKCRYALRAAKMLVTYGYENPSQAPKAPDTQPKEKPVYLKKYTRICSGCGKSEEVSTKGQLERQCRSCSKMGNISSKNLSAEARAKMADAKRGTVPWNKGMGAPKAVPMPKPSLTLAPKPVVEVPKKPQYTPEYLKSLSLEDLVVVLGSERKAAKALGMGRMEFVNFRFKLLNLCVQCKKVPPKEDCTRCAQCLEKAKGHRTKEQRSAYNQEYREKNAEKLRAAAKAYQLKNLEKFRAGRKKYDSTEAGRLSAGRRRAKRLGHEDQIMPTFDLQLLRATINFCERCEVTDKTLALDHHIPLSKGGKLSLGNTNLLCTECNSSKSARLPEVFFKPERLEAIQTKFWFFEQYKSVASPKEYTVCFTPSKSACRNFVKYHHYTGTCPGIIYAMTLVYEGRVLGVATFSKPSRQNITLRDCQRIIELSRFVVIDGTPKNTESYFLGKCLRWLEKNTDLDGVVSYADTTEGHTGVIYKATNFEEISLVKPNYHYEDAEGERIHKRQVWDRAKLAGLTEVEQAKAEGLTRIEESEKIKFGYFLKSGRYQRGRGS